MPFPHVKDFIAAIRQVSANADLPQGSVIEIPDGFHDSGAYVDILLPSCIGRMTYYQDGSAVIEVIDNSTENILWEHSEQIAEVELLMAKFNALCTAMQDHAQSKRI